MKPCELAKVIEEKFPISLSERYCKTYDAYDNSGLLVNSENDIKAVLFALDLTTEAVDYAIENKCQCVVTHHPAIYHPIKAVGDFSTSAILKAIQNGISVYSMHLNADVGVNGVDQTLCEMLGGKKYDICEKISDKEGYGKIFSVEKITLEKFVDNIKEKIHAQRILVYGNESNVVNKVGSFCGGGSSVAVEYGSEVDTVVTADMPHHNILTLTAMGKNIILLTHYASEINGLKRICDDLKPSLKGLNCLFFIDERFM